MEIRVTRVQLTKNEGSIVKAFVSIEIYLSNDIWVGIKDFKVEKHDGCLSVSYPTLKWTSKSTGKATITPLVRLPQKLYEKVQEVIMGAYEQKGFLENTFNEENGSGTETK